MAGAKGLEPSASGVTGRRYNQLNYAPTISEIVGRKDTIVKSKASLSQKIPTW